MLDQLAPYLEKKTDSFVKSLYGKVLEVSNGIRSAVFLFHSLIRANCEHSHLVSVPLY